MNSSFSQKLPGFQLAWDSTSLGELKRCPRAYQLSLVEGWQSRAENVHLAFGILVHAGRELYYRRRALGESHDDAVLAVVNYLLETTWDHALSRPSFVGSEQKNRFTLLRTMVWYLDHWEHDPLTTLLDAQGRPMVELSFRFRLGEAQGEEVLLCGHLDRVGEIGGQVWVNDLKTTKSSLDEGSSGYFFSGFSPDNQVSLYTFASQIVLARPAVGVMLDGAQVAQSFSRFARSPIVRTKSQLAEWLQGLQVMLGQAESYALRAFWPMNEKACYNCQFRHVCALPPAARAAALERDYVKRVWNPLVSRGE